MLTKKIEILGHKSQRTTTGQVQIQVWDKKERTARALKFGGMCWAAAIVSIIIPLLHFVLVPGFLLAGPILFAWIMNQESVLLGGEGVCPECRAALPIARGPNRFPTTDLCTNCQNEVQIRLAE